MESSWSCLINILFCIIGYFTINEKYQTPMNVMHYTMGPRYFKIEKNRMFLLHIMINDDLQVRFCMIKTFELNEYFTFLLI